VELKPSCITRRTYLNVVQQAHQTHVRERVSVRLAAVYREACLAVVMCVCLICRDSFA